MTIRASPVHNDGAGRFWVIVGSAVILFPAIYMTAIGWDSGEHANVPIGVGLLVSAWQGAVWTAIWLFRRGGDPPKRRLMFGAGVPLSLAGSLGLLAATQNTATPYARLGWAALAYLLLAALAAWVTRQPAA